jgi:hypothetical protein
VNNPIARELHRLGIDWADLVELRAWLLADIARNNRDLLRWL